MKDHFTLASAEESELELVLGRDAGLLHCDPCPIDADCEGHDPVGSPVLPTAKDGAYGVHYRHESPSSRLVS